MTPETLKQLDKIISTSTWDLKAKLLAWKETVPVIEEKKVGETGARTLPQNSSLHGWIAGVTKVCLESGITIEMILKPAWRLQVDEAFIKWLFRRIGIKKKFIKKSTTELKKVGHIDEIIDEMRLFFAHEVDPPIELPPFVPESEPLTNTRLAQVENLKNDSYPEYNGPPTI